MDASVLAAWASVATFVALLIGMAFIYGKLTQKTTDNAEDIAEHTERLDDHDDKLELHGIKLGRLEAYTEGLNTGSNMSRKTEQVGL